MNLPSHGVQRRHAYPLLILAVASQAAVAAPPLDLDAPGVVVSATRFNDSYLDKPVNISVIDRKAIDQTTARTLPDLLATQAGIDIRDFYGNAAAGATVDLRGFGASAAQNTLILVDGRRVTDIDFSGVQWSSLPLANIERIEIVRGGGSVQYGGGAGGGVINVITRTAQPGQDEFFVTGRAGSFDTYEGQVGASKTFEGVGIRLFGSSLRSQGYRDNNQNAQNNANADLVWRQDRGELRLSASADRQDIRLPGARRVDTNPGGTDLLATDRRGAATPLDYATRDGNQAAVDWMRSLDFGEAAIGLSWRNKRQTSSFDNSGFSDYRDVDLEVIGFTPRLKVDTPIAGLGNTLTAGFDLYDWNYRLEQSAGSANSGQPVHRVNGGQRTTGVWIQDHLALGPATTITAGYRAERFALNLTDAFDPLAPNPSFIPGGGSTGSQNETQHAWDLGLRQRLYGPFSGIVRASRGFRFATVDEIFEGNAAFSQAFQFLRPQTSRTNEITLEFRNATALVTGTLFDMDVRDEIRLDPFTLGVGNTNLPPLQRRGLELQGAWQASTTVALNGAYTYTEARFVEGVIPGGPFTPTNVVIGDKTVPLVPQNRLSLGITWEFQPGTRLNLTGRYVGEQVMENDEPNTFARRIPAYATADLRLSHRRGPFTVAVVINNLFDAKYYNYAVASQFTPGVFNAYPLPGLNGSVALTYTFQ